MEVIQGKSKDKKIVIAQEIAFAKVLAGNNKTLRDRAVKKLKKWLTLRGNGKWTFTEEEFMRLWTGLFYCMWMSDKFLIQEELAESISGLIHCFKKNSETALLFIKCFNKRILMDWEGLDQYRIDKFNMFVRRFLRQTFVYCKEKNWEETLLYKLMEIFYNVILHQDNSLGFIMHFIDIYAEELAKVSKGKIKKKIVLILIEPFVKLLARSRDIRIQKETEEFFTYLMRQTDTGIEFEEKFNAWKEQGYPGEGPHCMKNLNDANENQDGMDDGDDLFSEEEEGENGEESSSLGEPLDPRAGSVHVFLPQIPIDLDGLIKLFKKYQNSKYATAKGRRLLKNLIQKFEALKRGKFPLKIKKDPILTESTKKKRQTIKNAVELLKFTQKLDEKPIKTKEFEKMMKKLESQNENSESDEELGGSTGDIELQEKSRQLKQETKNNKITKKQKTKLNNGLNKLKRKQEREISNEKIEEVKEDGNLKENCDVQKKKKKNKNKNRRKQRDKNEKKNIPENEIVVKSKKEHKINGVTEEIKVQTKKIKFLTKTGKKRKILSNWQVQDLDSSSPEYNNLKTPKAIKLERRMSECRRPCEENEMENVDAEKSEWKNEGTTMKEIFPVFWEKAKKKVFKNETKGRLFVNPFANIPSESKSQSRRISFALEKNMAQENEEYLEEVKNSPRVPFDGSKKPIQSALKSGLAPSPVNPFYSFKKIKI